MMEKGPELLGKNRSANGSAKSPAGGGGSGASSTNGGLHFSEPESGCSSDDEHDVGMRVGAEYQARIPEFDPGRYICLGKILSPLCWDWFRVEGVEDGRGRGPSVRLGGDAGLGWAGISGGRLSSLAGL